MSQGSRTSPSPSASVDLAHLRPVRRRFSVHPATHPLSRGGGRASSLSAGSVRSVDRRDVIRSTIYWGSPDSSDVANKPESKRRHHSISDTSDGAVVGVRCGVVLMVVTSTGLRSTGGCSHRDSLVRFALPPFRGRAARYVVMAWSRVTSDNFLQLSRSVVSVGVVCSGVDV